MLFKFTVEKLSPERWKKYARFKTLQILRLGTSIKLIVKTLNLEDMTLDHFALVFLKKFGKQSFKQI